MLPLRPGKLLTLLHLVSLTMADHGFLIQTRGYKIGFVPTENCSRVMGLRRRDTKN